MTKQHIDGWKNCWVVYTDEDTARKRGYKTGMVKDKKGRILVFPDYDAAYKVKEEGRALFRLVSSVFHFCDFPSILNLVHYPADSPWIAAEERDDES